MLVEGGLKKEDFLDHCPLDQHRDRSFRVPDRNSFCKSVANDLLRRQRRFRQSPYFNKAIKKWLPVNELDSGHQQCSEAP